MPFDNSNSEEMGRKGGRSRSNKKRTAARRNGRMGGRRSSRTLTERLLGRKLTREQKDAVNAEWLSNRFLLMDESIRLLEFFGGSAATQTCPYSSNIWRRK